METEFFLNSPINALPANKQFCEQCALMGFKTIQEIIETGPEKLLSTRGFTYHWLAELSEALNKEGLLHLLQPLPGSIPG